MRLFEATIFVSFSAILYYWHDLGLLLICLVLGIPLFLHIIIEGTRWQMYPAYFSFVLLVATLGFELGVSMYHILLFAALSLFTSIFLTILIPVLRLPPLTGKYGVGTLSVVLEDKDRPWFLHSKAGKCRKLLLQVWYPVLRTDSPHHSLAEYFPNLTHRGPAFARSFSLPSFILSHFRHIRSRAWLLASPAHTPLRRSSSTASETSTDSNSPESFSPSQLDSGNRGFPVVIFSHGYTGTRSQNTVLLEDLASLGFFVAAMDHTGDSKFVHFGDDCAEFEAAPPQGISMEELREFRAKQLDGVRVKDVKFIFSRLRDYLNQGKGFGPDSFVRDCINVSGPEYCFDPSEWTNSLDLTRVATIGHSFGGATAIMCSYDMDIRACIGLDPWIWPIPDHLQETKSLPVPLLIIQAPVFCSGKYEYDRHNKEQCIKLADNCIAAGKIGGRLSFPGSSIVTVSGTGHLDFTDMSVIAPFFTRLLGLTGRRNGWEVQKMLTEYIHSFLYDWLSMESFDGLVPSRSFAQMKTDDRDTLRNRFAVSTKRRTTVAYVQKDDATKFEDLKNKYSKVWWRVSGS